MKKALPANLLGAVLLLFSLFSYEARANYAKAADLTYVNIGPNQYHVTLKVFRECYGDITDPAPAIQHLKYSAAGCNTQLSAVMNRMSQSMGNPVCGNLNPLCNINHLKIPNYEIHVYTAIITLPKACDNWILSSRIYYRTQNKNTIRPDEQELYTEAMINNLAVSTNSAPVYTTDAVKYLCVNQEVNWDMGVMEVDGDSLAFELADALEDAAIPVIYLSYSAGVKYGTNPPVPYNGGTYSATHPVIADPFLLDSKNGQITIKPFVYYAATPAPGMNQYLVSIKVNEYRRLNGQWVKIGFTRREMEARVIDCFENNPPVIADVKVNGKATVMNQAIEVEAGKQVQLTISSYDPDQQDFLLMDADAQTLISGSSFTTSSAKHPLGTFTWTPQASDIRTAPYSFAVSLNDQGCPLPAKTKHLIQLLVVPQADTTIPTTPSDPADGAGRSGYTFPTVLQAGQQFSIHDDLKGATLTVYNQNGQVVKQFRRYSNEWRAEGMAAGLYYIRIESNEGNYRHSGKLVIVP